MRILLDEMLPIGVRELLPGHDVATAAYTGFAGLSNGELIERAIQSGYDVLVTLDRGIPHQQHLSEAAIGFVLIPDNDVDLIRSYAARLRAALEDVRPGMVIRVSRR